MLFKTIIKSLYLILDTFVSLIELLFRGNFFLKKINRTNEVIVVAGNGPSLKENLDFAKENIKDFKLAATNFYLLDNNLQSPDYYYLLDDRYFLNKSNLTLGSEKQEKELIERIEELYNCFNSCKNNLILYVPKNKINIVKNRIKNSKIHVVKVNVNTFNSSTSIRHFFYNHQLGIPKSQTVIITALFYSAHISRKIFLAGCDSSWMENLNVTVDNEVLTTLKHNDGNDLKIKYESMVSMLETQLNVFKSYEYIQIWSKTINVEIINLSKKSFIDVFKKTL